MHPNKLEQLRKDTAGCARIRDLTTDKATQEVFARLAERLNAIADQIETAMPERKAG